MSRIYAIKDFLMASGWNKFRIQFVRANGSSKTLHGNWSAGGDAFAIPSRSMP